MNKKETLQILGRIRKMYPRYFEGETPEEVAGQAAVWFEFLEDYRFEDILAGLKTYANTDMSGFPPTTGQIIGNIPKSSSNPTATQAWELVRKAVRNSTYHSEEEFFNLPEIIQDVIASPSYLSALALMESGSLGVQQSLFVKEYNRELEKREYMAKVPESVKKLYAKEPLQITEQIDGRYLIDEEGA